LSAFFSGALLSTQQKAALDLFDRRYGIYEIVHKAVDQMVSSSVEFDQSRESEFLQAMERAYFFFGKDVENYFEQLWSDILDVRAADTELSAASDPDTRRAIVEKRVTALNRIKKFYVSAQPLFSRYMRLSQTVGGPW